MVKDSLEIKGIQLNTYYFLLIKRIYSVLCMHVFVLFFNKKKEVRAASSFLLPVLTQRHRVSRPRLPHYKYGSNERIVV